MIITLVIILLIRLPVSLSLFITITALIILSSNDGWGSDGPGQRWSHPFRNLCAHHQAPAQQKTSVFKERAPAAASAVSRAPSPVRLSLAGEGARGGDPETRDWQR